MDKKCSVCNNASGFACSQCKTKKYCSKECQKSDWATHKHVCGAKMMAIYCCDPDKVDDTIQNHNIKNNPFGKFRKRISTIKQMAGYCAVMEWR